MVASKKSKSKLYTFSKKIKAHPIYSVIGLLISMIAVLTGAISLLINYYSYHSNSTTKFKETALNYRPRLKIVGEPKIDSVIFNGTQEDFIKQVTQIYNAGLNNRKYNIYFNISVYYRVKVTNTEKSQASILFVAEGDRNNNSIWSLKKDIMKYGANFIGKKDYTGLTYFNSGDTSEIKFCQQIRNGQNHIFNLHIYFVYKNEYGIIYDTYYWATYLFKPPTTILHHKTINNNKYLPVVTKFIADKNCLELVNYNSTSDFYLPEEADKILSIYDAEIKNFEEFQKALRGSNKN